MSKAILKKGMGLRLVALAAVVAAVALFGAVFTQSADAVGPGDSQNVSGTVTEFHTGANDGVARFSIDPNSSSSGSFAANGGQSITCQDGTNCDLEAADNMVTVRINIDDDSPTGFIIVDIVDLEGTVPATRDLISVSVADRAVAIAASSAADAIAFNSGGTAITATLTNNVGGGVNGQSVVIVTTLGVLAGCGTTSGTVQACSENTATISDGNAATTDDSGKVQVTLQGNNRSGVATVTFTSGGLSTSVDVVLYGNAASISAEAMQSSIAIGGSTYIVVTALDAGGNPVVGHQVRTVTGANEVVGPAANSNEITVAGNMPFDHTDNTKDLPACDAGTNAAGHCVLIVRAPDMAGTANDASRGTHTVNIDGPGAAAATNVAVEIQVGGAPAAISSDAPANVDPLSSTTITLSVVDDAGVPVGAVASSVNQIEGEGKVIAGDGAGMTSDGAVSFTFLAPQTPGTAVFRVTAGEVASSIVVTIGDPGPTEAPSMESAVSLDLSAGGDYYSIPANSVPTSASALFDGTSVSVAWKWDRAAGSWTSYITAIGSTDFLVTSGDILWIVAGSAGTVGG